MTAGGGTTQTGQVAVTPADAGAGTPLERASAALAGPFAGDLDAGVRLLDLALHGWVTALLARFVETFGGSLAAASSGLGVALLRCGGRRPSFDRLWSPALTGVIGCLRGDAIDPIHAGAELAFDLAQRGPVGSWSARFESGVRLRVAGHLLPSAREVDVEEANTGVVAVLRYPDGRQVRYDLASAPEEGVDTLPVTGGGRYRILGGRTLRLGCELPAHIRPQVVDDVPAAFVRALSDADEALAVAGDAYGKWVRRVIREIVAVRAEVGAMRSGSSSDWPGIVYLSAAQPFAMAENLVHEACHQYFKVVTRVERASAEHDGDAYFSPFVGRERPLEAIVLAYHAFGNARLFLHLCRDLAEVPAAWLRGRIDELDTKLVACDPHLVGNPALTPAGRALLAPLQQALAEAVSADRA